MATDGPSPMMASERPDALEAGSDTEANEASGCAGCPEIQLERRHFLSALVLGAGATAGTALLVPWVGLFVTPLSRSDPVPWREIGGVGDFPVGTTTQVLYRDFAAVPWAGFAARSAAWIRRESPEKITAFTTYCTHVGCVVRWEESAQLFFCPCHGGAFHADGSVAAGPPPRPLDRHPIRIRDGRVEIQPLGTPQRSR